MKNCMKRISCVLICILLITILIPSNSLINREIVQAASQKYIQAEPAYFNPSMGETTRIAWNFEKTHQATIWIKNGEQVIRKLKTATYMGYYVGHGEIWDGKDDHGNIVPAGIYTIIIEPAEDRWKPYSPITNVAIQSSTAPDIDIVPNINASQNYKFTVYGKAPTNTQSVDIKIDGVLKQTARIENGVWWTKLSLPSYEEVKIEAVLKSDSTQTSKSLNVIKYAVRQNDTIRDIAQNYLGSARTEEIYQDNNLGIDANLRIGDNLLLINPRTRNQPPSSQSITGQNLGNEDIQRGNTQVSRDPVNLATGNYMYSHTDISISGSFPLGFRRFYNSKDQFNGQLGTKWHHNFEYRLVDVTTHVEVIFDDGNREWYEKTESGTYKAASGVYNELTVNPDHTYTLNTPSQIQYRFNKQGYVTAIIDRNGNKTELIYEDLLLREVKTPSGYLIFQYNDHGKIREVSDHTGRKITYEYNGENLIRYVNVEGKDIQYEYDDDHNLVKVISPSKNGTVVNEYDEESRVVAQTLPDYSRMYFDYDDENRRTILTEANGSETIYQYDQNYRITEITYEDGTQQFEFEEEESQGEGDEPVEAPEEEPTLGEGYIKVQMYNGNTASPNNTLFPWFKIYNTGTDSIDLSDVTVRYYYTSDGEEAQNFWCDWSTIGADKITGQFRKLADPQEGADTYFELGFRENAPVLGAGESVEAHIRLAKVDWSNYDQTNDFSFNEGEHAYIDWNKAAGFINGTCVWGINVDNGETIPAPLPPELPDPEPIPSPEGELIRVQMYNGNTADSINTLFPRFKIYNTSREEIPLSNIRVKYYYTVNGDRPQNFWCDWSSRGSRNVTGRFEKMETPTTTADYLFELGFKEGSGVLEPGQSVEAHIRLAKVGWTNYDQEDDYSINKNATNYIDWEKVVAYVGEVWAWGTEIQPGNPAIDPPDAQIPEIQSKKTRTAQTDKKGNTYHYTYDNRGNVTSVKDPMGQITQYSYNNNNQLTSVIQPDGSEARFLYDAKGNLLKATDPTGRTTEYEYNEQGLPTKVNMADGSSIEIQYDNAGNITEYQDGMGNITQFQYDELNRLTKITEPEGGSSQFTYTQDGKIAEEKDAAGNKISYDYDTNGNLRGVIDPEGYSTKYQYNQADQLIEIMNPLSDTIQYQYDSMGNVSQVTDLTGGITRYQYDTMNRLAEIIDPEGYKTSYQYDSNGNLIQYTDANGNAETYEYDSLDRITQIINPKGQDTKIEYNETGKVIKIINPLGYTTEYQYDPAGRVTGIKDALGHQTTMTYNEAGLVDTVTDAQGATTHYQYNANGDMIQRKNAQGESTQWSYDKNGNVISVTDPKGQTTTYTYDILNRVKTIKDEMGQIQSITYTPKGQIKSITDALGNQTTYQYDPVGNLIQLTDAQGHKTTYEYDAAGNLTEVHRHRDIIAQQASKSVYESVYGSVYSSVYGVVGTDIEFEISQYEYDKRGLLKKSIDPLGGIIHYEYDGNGNRITKVDEENQTTTYQYDSTNLVRSINYGGEKQVLYQYNEAGQLVQMEDWNGITQLEVDPLGRIEKVTDPKDQTIKYTWTKTGQKKSMTYPDGSKVSYSYDLLGRLEKVTDPNNQITQYQYDPLGNLIETTLPNKAKTQYEYDQRSQKTKQTEIDPAGVILDQYQYEYDLAGNQIQEEKERQGIPGKEEITYRYDALNQLKEVHRNDQITKYFYDTLGNRVQKEQWTQNQIRQVETYRYNQGSQLILKEVQTPETAGYTTYSYDKKGNLQESIKDDTIKQTYSYDPLNQLEKVVTPTGQVDDQYNGFGNRISTKRMEAGKEEEVNYLTDITSPYNNILMIETGDQTSRYTYGLQRISVDTETKAGKEEALYYLQDHLGSTSRLLDESGKSKVVYSYDEFGIPKDTVGLHQEEVYNPFGYTGYQYESITGLYYAQARYYNPEIGRFTEKDPIKGTIAEPNTMNPYIYVGNNPIMYIDPTGLVAQSHGDDYSVRVRADDSEHWLSSPIDTWMKFEENGSSWKGNDNIAKSPKQYMSTEEVYKDMIKNGVPAAYARRVAAGYRDAMKVYKSTPMIMRFTPGVDTIMDATEAYTEKDIFTKEKLSTFNNALNKTGLLLSLFGADIGDDIADVKRTIEGMSNLNPSKIRFSQSSVNGAQEIIESMSKNGWEGDPIDVVRMADGGLTTIDNTRVVAARAAGIDVQAVVHNADDLLPEHLIERFTTKKGVPTTWGEAIELRIGKQKSSFRNNNPFGSYEMEMIK